MARKSKETYLKEYAKLRVKYMRYARELERCHPSSKRRPDLLEKTIGLEEECIFLNRKIFKWKKGDHDRFIL